jgi:hypothetical protein
MNQTATVDLDERFGIDGLERASLVFSRSAPAALIASAIEAMVEEFARGSQLLNYSLCEL